MDSEQKVTPWVVTTTKEFNYEILIEEFGLSAIDKELIQKFEKIIDQSANHFLTRGIFYAHQDFDKIIEAKRIGKEIYIYTGRGPSSDSLHIGHMIPLMF